MGTSALHVPPPETTRTRVESPTPAAAVEVPAARIDPTTVQRFEFKFLVSERLAWIIRENIRPFVVPDTHSHGADGYRVSTVYFDTPDLALYRSSVNGEKNRFKLRCRDYGVDGGGQFFVEIKRRINQVIQKQRARLPLPDASALFEGGAIPGSTWQALDGREESALHAFLELQQRLNAAPTVSVFYTRDAYVSVLGEPARVTFDWRLSCLSGVPVFGAGDSHEQIQYPFVPGKVVLEIKFSNECPGWARQIVQRYDLERESVSKYVIAADALMRQSIAITGGERQ